MAEPKTGKVFCGVSQSALANVGEQCKWNHAPVTIGNDMDLSSSNIAPQQIQDVFTRVAATWSSVCGIDLRVAVPGTQPNIFARSGPLDGRNGVLGQSYLPCGNVTPAMQLLQLYDNGEAWTVDFLFRVVLHEVGHAIGLDHAPGGTAVMSPYLTNFSSPQAWDIAEVRGRYGPPIIHPVDPVDPPVKPVDGVDLFKPKLVQVPWSGIISIPKAGRYALGIGSGTKAKQVKITLAPALFGLEAKPKSKAAPAKKAPSRSKKAQK